MTGWQLEGNAAEAYERYLVPAFFAPFAERLVAHADPRPTDRALDVACGTGIVARKLAPLVQRVAGLDPNAGMLEVARANAPAIEWIAAEAGAIPLPDATFDLVTCQQGVQFFPDRAAGLRELRRVLAPGGRLVLSIWRAAEHSPGWLRLAEALDRHAGPEAGAIQRRPFSLGGAEARTLLHEAGFSAIAVRIDIGAVRFPSAGDLLLRQEAASPLAGPLSALAADIREALVRDVTDSLRPYADDDGVSFPMETHIVTAVR
ncbi:MAG TPA: methyltransferase domain-containing protein [Solirubrobacteraceae bacterium]|nr:methyltransferase domain-containing protein [Solirubrobacteraceae bacterium]